MIDYFQLKDPLPLENQNMKIYVFHLFYNCNK